jgi:uncharacterized protein YjgD (DUF1641 family)
MALSDSKQKWVSELEKPEIQDSLAELVKRMPEIQQTVESLERFVTFGQAVLEDTEAVGAFEDRFSHYNLNEDTVQAFISLMEKLPLIVRMVDQLEQISSFITSVLKDKESMSYLTGSFQEYADPLIKGGSSAIELLNKVKTRAEEKNENYSIFTILKWLKDPSVQKGLSYVQATIDVLSEEKKER